MSVIKAISMMSKSGYSDRELLVYIDKHYDEIECELNGEEHKEPKKCDRYFCMVCKLRKTVDYERSILTCTKCGVFEYYPVYVASYNHTMQPSRRKCIYKRSDNFKAILFFPHITTKEYNTILGVFNVKSSIYDKYKPNHRKSFLNYFFILKKILIMLGKVEYAKYIPQLKTHSKQNELERVWELITKDREWAVALRK